ncbi:MAG: FAD-dependent oxidoreductase, partial [Actinobacteria bacterium]|nr:FAD-dependent oxidoreductase [Actinomycetota bacterium]
MTETKKIKTGVAVIGAGITGSAIARELSKYRLDITVIEKEADVGWGTTKANTGLLHPGYAGEKGTLRLSLCRKGKELFLRNAEELSVPVRHTSSLLNGFNDSHINELEKMLEQGMRLGVAGLKIIRNNNGSSKDIEPNLSNNVKASLFSREHFSVSPYETAEALYENSVANGIKFLLSSEVLSIHFNKTSNKFVIEIGSTLYSNLPDRKDSFNPAGKPDTVVEADFIVNAAGVSADEIASMIGDDSFKIKAIKGQYFLLDSDVKDLVRHQNIRMSDPDNQKSKGMVVGITTGGNHIIGSNYEATDKHDFSTSRAELDEIRKKLSSMIENIPFEKVITTFAGLRAYADTGDFVLGPSIENKNFINAAGIQSPGLTCAFAIAEIIVDCLKESGLELSKNSKYMPVRQKQKKLDMVDLMSNNLLYSKDAGYAEIVCRCEKVSEAEVVDAIKRGATTLDSVKFRVRAGMGRCQGGYCTLRVMKILSRELGLPFEKITKSGGNSNPVK